MHSEFHLRLCPAARLHTDGEDWLISRGRDAPLRQHKPGPATRALIEALATSGGRADDLIAQAQAAEPEVGAATLVCLLHVLELRGLLSYGLTQDGQPLATLEPMTPSFSLAAPVADPAVRYRLSRFATLRRDDEEGLIECPLGHARLRLHDGRLAAVVVVLAGPQTAASLATLLPQLSSATVTGLIRMLMSAQAVFVCDEAGSIPEDLDPALRQWEPHDLAFHVRSRLGRHDVPLGRTDRFVGELSDPPALKPPGPGARVDLPRPDPCRTGRDFFEVVEARRTYWGGGLEPVTRDQLGTLLWHVARVQAHRPVDPDDPNAEVAIMRPVGGGVSMDALELYLTVTRCTGLEPGLYRYDSGTHALEWIASPSAATEGLARDAMRSAAMKTSPDVLVILAARFARVNWRYESIAYALILKYVGVLYQQLYLVATALGLSPGALGAGDSERFAAAAGTRYYEETSVGEFTLSGPPIERSESTRASQAVSLSGRHLLNA